MGPKLRVCKATKVEIKVLLLLIRATFGALPISTFLLIKSRFEQKL